MTQPAFSGQSVVSYTEGPPRQVPGFDALHRMTAMLLAERVPEHGRVLVIGAGGGLELKFLAEAHPGWRFDGVDPSADMLDLARRTVGPLQDRMGFHLGYVDDAPEGPYDAAVSLLTFHFIPRDQRLDTLVQIRRRLTGGAPFVLAHLSFAQTEPERARWIGRHVAFGASPDTSETQLAASRQAIATRLSIIDPAEEEALLRQSGFDDISLFYAGLGFRGWLANAA